MSSTNDESPNTIVADPEDSHASPKRSHNNGKSSSKMPLSVKVVVGGVVLVGGFLILVALTGWGDNRGEDELKNLSRDLAGTRADLLLVEERLAEVEGYGNRLQRLDEGDKLVRENLENLNGFVDRLDTLEQRITLFSSQMEVRMSAFSERLDNELEEAEAAVDAAEQQAQLARDEARRAASAQAEAERLAARSTSQAPTRSASPPRPPFSISGVEYRGGRKFLSIAVGPVSSLSEVKMLGERETEGEWQLVSIGSASAEFYHRGRSVSVPLP